MYQPHSSSLSLSPSRRERGWNETQSSIGTLEAWCRSHCSGRDKCFLCASGFSKPLRCHIRARVFSLFRLYRLYTFRILEYIWVNRSREKTQWICRVSVLMDGISFGSSARINQQKWALAVYEKSVERNLSVPRIINWSCASGKIIFFLFSSLRNRSCALVSCSRAAFFHGLLRESRSLRRKFKLDDYTGWAFLQGRVVHVVARNYCRGDGFRSLSS